MPGQAAGTAESGSSPISGRMRYRPSVATCTAPQVTTREVAMTEKPHATGAVAPGDIERKVGIEMLRQRGIDVEELVEKLIDNAGAEFASTYYYYSILRMYLAGHEDYKEICEDARLEDRQHYELILPRIYELGGSLPYSLHEFADRAGCPAAYLPGTDNGQHPPAEPPPAAEILTVLLEAE